MADRSMSVMGATAQMKMGSIGDLKVSYWRAVELSSSVPVGRSGAGCVVYEDPAAGPSILVFGGQRGVGGAYCDALLQFSFASQSWSIVQGSGTAPTPRVFSNVVMSGGNELFVFGGWDGAKCVGDLYYFRCVKKKWEKISYSGKIPERFGACSVVHGGNMYVFGGENVDGFLNDFWEYNISKKKWNPVKATGSPPPSRGRASCALYGDLMYVFGGQGVAGVYNDLWTFNFTTRNWAQLKPGRVSPPARCDASMVVHKDFLYIFGGSSMGGRQCFNDVHEYSLTHNVWRGVAVSGIVPPPRFSACALVFMTSLYIFFGREGDAGTDYNQLHELSLDSKVQEQLHRQVQEAETEASAYQKQIVALQSQVEKLTRELDRLTKGSYSARAARINNAIGGAEGDDAASSSSSAVAAAPMSAQDKQLVLRSKVLPETTKAEEEALIKESERLQSILSLAELEGIQPNELLGIILRLQKQLLDARQFREKLLAKLHQQESDFLRSQLKNIQRERDSIEAKELAPAAADMQKIRQERDFAYLLLQESQRGKELIRLQYEELLDHVMKSPSSLSASASLLKNAVIPAGEGFSVPEDQRKQCVSDLQRLLAEPRTELEEIYALHQLTTAIVESVAAEMNYSATISHLKSEIEQPEDIHSRILELDHTLAKLIESHERLSASAISTGKLDPAGIAERDSLLLQTKESMAEVEEVMGQSGATRTKFITQRKELFARLTKFMAASKLSGKGAASSDLSALQHSSNIAEVLQQKLGSAVTASSRVGFLMLQLREALQLERETVIGSKKAVEPSKGDLSTLAESFCAQWSEFGSSSSSLGSMAEAEGDWAGVTIPSPNDAVQTMHHVLVKHTDVSRRVGEVFQRREASSTKQLLQKLVDAQKLVLQKQDLQLEAKKALDTMSARGNAPPADFAKVQSSLSEAEEECRKAEQSELRVLADVVELAVAVAPEILTQRPVPTELKKLGRALVDSGLLKDERARKFISDSLVR